MHVLPLRQGVAKTVFTSANMPHYQLPLESQLLEYCKLDTFAMVRLWEFFRGRSA